MSNISYVAGSNQSFNHPAYTRRFPRYAARNHIPYSDYVNDRIVGDVSVLSLAADITFWRREKRDHKSKIVFDANDPFLLSDEKTTKDLFRGAFKFISGKHKYLEFSYKNSYLQMCKEADLVIVGHYAQYELLEKISKNVMLISDYGIDVNIEQKTNFQLSDKTTINVFWEGLGSSFKPFKMIEQIFEPIRNEFNFVFHFVTDLSFYKYGDQFLQLNTIDIAKKEAPLFFKQFRFYQWSEYMMNKIAIACDFAVIPLPSDRSMNFWKPENKLIHMWRMSLPAITSPIPSYVRVLNDSNQNLYADSFDEWRELVLEFSKDELCRLKHGMLGNSYANKMYSDEKIDALWEEGLNMI